MLASTLELLRDILREAEFLCQETAHTTEDDFMHDEVRKRAFVRSMEIIGEAAKPVPAEARAEHPGLEWKKMAGMRDRLIHDYGGVDYSIVWNVATAKAPGLATRLKPIVTAADAALADGPQH